MMRRQLTHLLHRGVAGRCATGLAALTCGLLACGPTTDLTGQTGAMRLAFGAQGCGLSYTGGTPLDPNALDLSCPASLLPLSDRPTLHLSAPLALAKRLNIPQPLKDMNFAQTGAQLGHFVVATYAIDGRTVRCDPREATGSVLYIAIPTPSQPGNFTGQFSQDAALRSCVYLDTMQPASPLALFGSFDLVMPR